MSPRTTSRRLAASLTTTLQAKAEQVAIPSRSSHSSFPPNHHDDPLETSADTFRHGTSLSRFLTGGRRPRRGRVGVVVAAAAAVVIVAAAVGVAILDGQDRSGDPADTMASGRVPDDWLVPTWVPEGMELWDVQWTGPSPRDPAAVDGVLVYQLLGDPSEGRAIYIDVMGFAPGHEPAAPDDADAVNVRGGPGWATTSVDIEEQNPVASIVWNERSARITARYKGVSRDDALDALAGLQWRGDRIGDGFAPPADGSWPVKAESLGWSGATGRGVRLLYSHGVPSDDRPALSVSTTITGGTPLGYLEEWFYEGPEASGGGTGPSSAFRESRDLHVAWPDGREISILPAGPSPDADTLPDRATLERIAESLTEVDEEDLVGMRQTVAGNISALPLAASADTTAGTLEVHAEGGFQRLCLRRPGDPALDCGDTGGVGFAPSGATEVSTVSSWMIEGTWYVGAAATGVDVQLFGDRGPDVTDDVLPVDEATDGAWQLQLVQVPPEVQQVSWSVDGGNSGVFSVSRPT